MADFDKLSPGTRAAKAKGCICPATDGITIKALPECPLHGLDPSARTLDDPKNARALKVPRRKWLKQNAATPPEPRRRNASGLKVSPRIKLSVARTLVVAHHFEIRRLNFEISP